MGDDWWMDLGPVGSHLDMIIKTRGTVIWHDATAVEPRLYHTNGWVAFLNGQLLPGWFKSRKTAKAALRKAQGVRR